MMLIRPRLRPIVLVLLLASNACNSPQATQRSPVGHGTADSARSTPAEKPATSRPVLNLPTTLPRKAATVPSEVAYASVDSPFPDSLDPRQTLPFLASDALAGRLPGTPGLQRASEFLSLEFKRIGLKPFPGHDYYQPFTMLLSAALDPSSSISVNDRPLKIETDFVPMGLSAQGSFRGKMVYAGYAITRDQGDYDDFAGVDAKGKIVLAMMKEPLDEKNHSRFAGANQTWSASAFFSNKAKNAAAHGATALLLVAPPSSGGADSLNPFFLDSGPSGSTIPVVQITRRVADVLLANAEVRDLKTLQDETNGSFKPRSTDLINLELTGNVTFKKQIADVRNVMAFLPGSGPHADEWVVVGAHYDHLGKGQLGHMVSGKVGTVFHGADDNASGTAAVLELADHLSHAAPLPRSVAFVFFTGEEEGLVGSDHFVKNPPIAIEKMVAMLNLDMVGRLKDGSLLVGGQSTAAVFDDLTSQAVKGTALSLHTFERGGLGPSDHMSFALRKIPVLFLFTGLHQDYHRPTDIASKVNYDGIDQIVTVGQSLVTAMASMPRQQYDGKDDGNSTMSFATGHGGEHRAALGVVPDYASSDTRPGVPISGVGTGTAAATAGLKAGDLLVSYNTTVLNNLQDLSEMLAEASPGDRVTIKIIRDGKPSEVHAVLGERKAP